MKCSALGMSGKGSDMSDDAKINIDQTISSAWARLNEAASKRNMEISVIESDEQPPAKQRWLVWVKPSNQKWALSRGQYGAIGVDPADAMDNLTKMLEGGNLEQNG
jgi:hypothetical protein